MDETQLSQYIYDYISNNLNDVIIDKIDIDKFDEFNLLKYKTDKKTISIKLPNFKCVKNGNELPEATFKPYTEKTIKRIKSNTKGLYFFIANEDFKFNLFDNYYPFISLGIKDNKKISLNIHSVPHTNKYKNESFDKTIEIKKGDLIYVGKTSDIKSRFKKHYANVTVNNDSLKLGLRPDLKDKLSFYFYKVNPDLKYIYDSCDLTKYNIKCNSEYGLEAIIRYVFQARMGSTNGQATKDKNKKDK